MNKTLQQYARRLIAKLSPTVSQLGQDYWVINQVFDRKKNGYFIEIGAHDGIELSNTYLLEKRYRWSGLCIEANPKSFQVLSSIRDSVCLNICLDSEEKEVKFQIGGMMGGIIGKDLDNRAANEIHPDVVSMTTRRLEDVLDEQSAPTTIDYLSIDVEGAEERILADFNFSKYMFRAITVERPSKLIQRVFRENGYLLVRSTPGLDYFYIHQSHEADYMHNILAFYRKRRLLLSR